jgi:predicted Zn-dependent peptidase
LPVDPAVHVEVLDNGVTYLAKRGGNERKVVQLSLVVRVGTFAEAESERGFAHLVEHMAFSGTQHFPRQQLRQLIGWQGTSLNAHVHGRTGPDWTYFDLELPAQDPFQIPQVWQTEVGIGSQALKSSAQRYLRSDQYVDAMLLPEGAAGDVAASGDR